MSISVKILMLLVLSIWANLSYARDIQLTFHEYVESKCRKNCVDPEALLTHVKESAEAYNVDWKTMLAIIRVESAFQPKAKSTGNVGLTQVNLRYHRKKFASSNYFDVQDNVKVGTNIFAECLRRQHWHMFKALRCYNGGGDPRYAEKIFRARQEIRGLQFNSNRSQNSWDYDPLEPPSFQIKLSVL